MPRLKPEQLAELAAIAEAGPDRKRDGVARWPWVDLERIIAALKKLADVLSARLPDLPKGTPVEIWFQDEARIGEKNGLVRQRARRGTRLRQPADQRYENAYLFGAICPHARNRRGAGAAFRQYGSDADPPRRDRRRRRPCRADLRPRRLAHHAQSRLPPNLAPTWPPLRGPERNPVENVWQYLRANWLSNSVFETFVDIIDAACHAWRNLTATPEVITSIGMRRWVHAGLGQTL